MNNILNLIGTIAPLFSLVGTYCIILSYSKSHEIEHTINKGKEAQGTVINMRDDPDYSPANMKYRGKAPVVEFRTQNGLYHHYSTTFRKNSQYEIGQNVKIHYYKYKSRMEMALPDDETGNLPKTLLKWGIIFCAIGYPILLLKIGGFF